jgi:deoxyribose-phosphate aldolase
MPTWTRKKVAKTLDHAALKANMTDKDIAEACQLGRKYGVATVCVRPSDVPLAARELAGSDVKVSAVIGFPHGAHRAETKALEARLAIRDGAKELDMVMNVGKFLSGDFAWVQQDIAGVVGQAKPAGVLVKVILESTYLTLEQVAKACEIARAAGADFVKTSTGFAEGGGGATKEAIAVMVKTVGATMGVKASGGVRDYAGAVAFLEQGCTRLGTAGGTKPICENAPADGGGY